MITELKRTPITWNGEDGWEVLVQDDCIFEEDSCDFCMYRDWNDWEDCGASCCEVHGCGIFQSRYFIFQ